MWLALHSKSNSTFFFLLLLLLYIAYQVLKEDEDVRDSTNLPPYAARPTQASQGYSYVPLTDQQQVVRER